MTLIGHIPRRHATDSYAGGRAAGGWAHKRAGGHMRGQAYASMCMWVHVHAPDVSAPPTILMCQPPPTILASVYRVAILLSMSLLIMAT